MEAVVFLYTFAISNSHTGHFRNFLGIITDSAELKITSKVS
jgi:hypothetical protein